MEPTIQERTATLNIIRKIDSIRNRISDDTENVEQVLTALDDTINDINRTLFPGNEISEVYEFNIQKDGKEEFEREFKKWKTYIEKILEKSARCKNKTEADFEILMAYLEVVKREELEQVLKDNLAALKNKNKRDYVVLTGTYNIYADFWGALNPEKGIFDCIHQRTEALKEHIGEWKWLFGELCDNRSRKGLYNILANWITFSADYLKDCKEGMYKDYFDLDLIPETSEDEVFVDLGGFIGDTVEDFVNVYSAKYKRIYTYEINPHNLKCLQETVRDYSNVIIKENAVGEEEGTLYLDLRLGGPSTTLDEKGEVPINVVSLDDDITEKVTWIKMDIEGSEQAALRGCKKHIQTEKPKLTICTYHNNEDLWKISMMVKEYNPEYKLYFRCNGGGITPSEYVLFAL